MARRSPSTGEKTNATLSVEGGGAAMRHAHCPRAIALQMAPERALGRAGIGNPNAHMRPAEDRGHAYPHEVLYLVDIVPIALPVPRISAQIWAHAAAEFLSSALRHGHQKVDVLP